ncbi:MAG: alpha/beta hydrolase [Ilumatobacteraceae bacterium]
MTERSAWQSALAHEARAAPELASFAVATGPLLLTSPRGDGHTVIVLPGFGGDDVTTTPLRWFLGRLGYRAIGWGLGRNMGFDRRVAAGLDELLTETSSAARPASLVGWSLGGVQALDAARRRSARVRAIVTLGSPLIGRFPPAGVPTTSIHSRTDAIVPWRASLLTEASLHENVEVNGSHLGLGHNPAVALIVADRLAQRPGAWQPFRPPNWARRFLPAA